MISGRRAERPDAQPLQPEDVRRLRPTPRAKIIRRALRLTQEQFALRYHIPIGTLGIGNRAAPNPTSPRAPIYGR